VQLRAKLSARHRNSVIAHSLCFVALAPAPLPPQQPPDGGRLATAVRMLKAAAPGSESHAAAALQLNQLSAAKVEELLRAQGGRKQRTAAAERRLLQKVVAANKEAETALIALYEALFFRCGRPRGPAHAAPAARAAC
jgi:hypothetical protein